MNALPGGMFDELLHQLNQLPGTKYEVGAILCAGLVLNDMRQLFPQRSLATAINSIRAGIHFHKPRACQIGGEDNHVHDIVMSRCPGQRCA